jgi:hypothetical protein
MRQVLLAVINDAARRPDDDGPLGTPDGAQRPIIIASSALLAVIRG